MGLAFYHQEPLFAIVIVLGFNCLLRTTEMLNLTHQHVVVHPRDNGLSIIFPESKTSQGNPPVLLVTDSQLVRLVKRWLQPQSEEMLWPKGLHLFRQAFSMFWAFQRPIAPLIVSAGGEGRGTFKQPCHWMAQCTKTARAYIDEGTAQLAHVSWSRAQRKKVDKWTRYLSKVRLPQERKIGGS
jgi:hypothetical protein